MNKELMGALDELEREKNISKETLLDAIEQSLIDRCKKIHGLDHGQIIRYTIYSSIVGRFRSDQ